MTAWRFLGAWLLALASLPTWAHKPSDSYLGLDWQGNHLTAQWDIALRDLDAAIGLDADGDGQLTWGEVRARHGDIAAHALSHLVVTADGQPCAAQACNAPVAWPIGRACTTTWSSWRAACAWHAACTPWARG
mgnify:CR=1 FL=1